MAESQNGRSPRTNVKKADELPPPPPPPPQEPTSEPAPVAGTQDSSPLPLPPPKESFSKFYQQRQVNELKRLYRHMHPELRKNLEEAVTEDLAEVLSTEDPGAQVSGSQDTVVPGEVQSMRWIFENWNLDSIGERQAAKKLTEEEAIPSGDVKTRSMRFEGQLPNGDKEHTPVVAYETEQTKGDVHTARWLFETQPLDSLNKIYLDETDLQEAVLKEPVQKGDVKGAAQLFETYSLEALGRCSSVEEQSILQLKSEIQELKGDVKKTIKLFQTEPLCAIRDKNGNMHEIKSVCREEIQSNAVKTARWLFETQPLDTINKDPSKVQVIRGISLEEVAKGNVSGAKWLFETQPLDAIRELTVEEADFKASPDLIQGADVGKQCQLFETQPLASLKGDASASVPVKEEVVKGDVKSTLWLFETQPMETLKDSFEVGHLKKVELAEEEKGAVRETKHVFETCPLDSIAKSPSKDVSVVNIQEVDKGDVKAFKTLFETIPLDSIRQGSTEEGVQEVQEILHGNVKANQFLFETTPLYAIKDSFGNFHRVTSVSREEEVMGGDVKNYKWMFETKPLDQFDESIPKVDVIKGITKQEVVAGDVKTAKWLFETQPIDVIHSQVNPTEQKVSEKGAISPFSEKGDVKTCRWLFETQPMDALYEKDGRKQDEEPVPQGDVKTSTWMFETQPLDSLKGQEEQHLQVSKAFGQHELQGVDVKTTRHLFETEPLADNIASDRDSKKVIRYSSRVEIQSGEVSRVKEFFEAKPLGSTHKPSTAMKEADIPADGNIEQGAVHKFTWLFENCPMDTLKNSTKGIQEVPPEKDVRGGDVGGKRFVFETYSLGQIHDRENEVQIQKIQEQTMNKADVRSCTMQFETQPLYAIQDKEGGYHEVTSVKKEEIMKGDVKGARWQFETKPLDQIKRDEEVFVIRAVTQEDFRKGDVQAARWRFETEPLDSITEEKKPVTRTVDDVPRGDVRSNKQLFESEQLSQKKYVRTVSVSDVQQGDVRTSTWLFENHPIDSLKGEPESTSGLTTVQREDIHKGDVKRSTWLFESQPMDSLKDTEAPASAEPLEVVLPAKVKSTTWLFESTPLDKLSTTQMCAETEVKERTVTETLEVLSSHQVIQHNGILIEAHDTKSVKMAKYQLGHQRTPEIQKEEVVEGNLQRILLQLLRRTNVEAQGTLAQEEESGQVKTSPVLLLDPSQGERSNEDLKDEVVKALQELLCPDASVKKGIIMQETERGTAKITIYSLRCVAQESRSVKGDVKPTIGSLLASSQGQRATSTIRREDNEKGNVQLYTSCIEKGDLDYLKNLQRESEIESLASAQAKEEAARLVQEKLEEPAQQRERRGVTTTAGGVSGVNDKAKHVILCDRREGTLEREAVRAKDTASTGCCFGNSQPSATGKESLVSGHAPLTFQSVQATQSGGSGLVREEKSLLGERKERTTASRRADQKQELLPGGDASQETTHVLGGDLQSAMQSLRTATAEAQTLQHQVQTKLQHQVQTKLQKTTEDIRFSTSQPPATSRQDHPEAKPQPASGVPFVRVQEPSRPPAKVSRAKVSASEEGQGPPLPSAARQDSQRGPSADLSIKDGLYAAKPVKPYANPFVESDYREHSVPEEREPEVVIRGDVKMAIQALQSATTGQRHVDKEDVVRGNLRAALESLEKSNVNVSKGDFKAAMIYRNAGQSYTSCKKKDETRSVSDQAADVLASGSRAVNDFPPPASVMGAQCRLPPTPVREVDVPGGVPSVQPSVPQTPPPAPAKPSNQRSLEKPQLPPKPDVIPPPRKKPVLPPKPECLMKEALLHPTGCNKGQAGKAAPQLSPPKPPGVAEEDRPKTLTITNQERAYLEGEVRGQSASMQPSTGGPSPSSSAAVGDIGCEDKALRVPVKTPLQVAEAKYKARKEEPSKGEGAEPKPSAGATKHGLIGCDGGSCHLEKETEGVVESYHQENAHALSRRQDSLSLLDCQTGLANQESERKPYLSAKCHANVLRKGVTTTQASSSKTECTGIPGALGCKDSQTASPKTQEEKSGVTLSSSSSFQPKQFFRGHEFVSSKGLGDPGMETEQSAETEKPRVVMREKACRETEDERLKRLSVHKEEIMKGNVQEAMEIFENLRKQEALQEILTRVKEFEEETSQVDVKVLRSFFENVPDWVVHHNTPQAKQPKVEKPEQMRGSKEDTDSVSSVELAFEDLERASAEIIHLKEQTLSRLMDIEAAIRKALCSISSLKSESDLAGLSGLLKESLGNSPSLPAGNNIRKISIVSSKARSERGVQNSTWEGETVAEKPDVPKVGLEIPHVVPPRASSPSSPSFISIQSAARKTAESPQMGLSPISAHPQVATGGNDKFALDLFGSLPHKTIRSDGCNLGSCDGEQEAVQMKKGASLIKQQLLTGPEHLQPNGDKEQQVTQNLALGVGAEYPSRASLSALSPSNPRRQKSILELQTSSDGSKLYGATRTVTEQYEEVDEFGNKIITSSTTVTKQSETQTSSTCGMVSCPTRYEVTASPILRRYLNCPADFPSNGGPQETGVVFVTFSNSKPAKK